ncbi:MAG: IPT/TIG domain-containing protein [Micropepsaceae bacterium]
MSVVQRATGAFTRTVPDAVIPPAWRRWLGSLLVMFTAMIATAVATTAGAASCSGAGTTAYSGIRYGFFNISDTVSPTPPGECAFGPAWSSDNVDGDFAFLRVEALGGDNFSFVFHPAEYVGGGLSIPPSTMTVSPDWGLTELFPDTNDLFGNPPDGIYTVTLTYTLGGNNYTNVVTVEFVGSTFAIRSGSATGGGFGAPQPTLSAIAPVAGPLAGGQSVTLTGTGLTGATGVTIGGAAAASVTVVNDTTVTAVTPSGAAGARNVEITTPGGAATLTNGYTYAVAPTLTSVLPGGGPRTGGITVVVLGTGLTGATSVTLDGVAATDVVVVNPGRIEFTAPSVPTAGLKDIVVTTPGGTATLAAAYRAIGSSGITAISPNVGPLTGGQAVTITGANFYDVSALTEIGAIGGASLTNFVIVNDTTITAVTSANTAGVYNVAIATAAGTVLMANGYTYADIPTASSLSPVSGAVAGGTSVTITGANFVTGDTSVTIGGIVVPASSVTVNSATSLTFTTPAHAAGNVSVSVSTSGGASSDIPGGYTYANSPTATSLSPAFGPVSGGTLVSVSGTNFVTGDTSVTIDGIVIPAASVTVNSATSLTFSTPAHAAGTVAVSVSTSGGTSSSIPGGFTYAAIPTGTSLSPTSGGLAGGTAVTITGANFISGDTTVTIGGNVIPAGSVTVNSATSLTFSTPAHAAGNVAVTVATSGGASGPIPGGYTYTSNAPTAFSLTPDTGASAGGTVVTVTGTNFVFGSTSVTIGGATIPAASVTVNSATSLTFTTPANAAGNVDVTVTTPNGATAPVPGGFTYVGGPTAVSLSPAFGPTSGGTLVTVSGSDFVAGNTTVTIGGTVIPAGSVTVNSATSLTFVTPAFVAGNAYVLVTTPGGSSAAVPGGFTFVAAPTANALSPSAGPVAGGTMVTVTGTNFVGGDTTVTIGGNVVPAGSVTVNSSTSLTFATPAHAAGNVAVSVTTSGGTSGAIPGGYTYANAPTAVSLSPVFGPSAGGTSVTISGTNFIAGDTGVTIGGNPVSPANVTVNSSTSLTFTTPAHAAGNVAVSVNTSGGASNTVPGGFTYAVGPTVTSITPAVGPVAGGTAVTITGTGFVPGDASVTIGGNVIPAASVTVNSATSLTFVTPPGASGAVNVSVTTSGGTSGTVPGGFTYAPVSVVTGITPAVGPLAGGNTVSITGSGFVVVPSSVTIGGAAATNIVRISSTQITVTVPSGTAGFRDVTVLTPGGSGTLVGGYRYLAAPVIAGVSPYYGPTAGGNTVTITGANLDFTSSVTFGGVAATNIAVQSSTQITVTAPAHTAATVDVAVTSPGGTATQTLGYAYLDGPTVTSLDPAAGPVAGGNTIAVYGTGFVSGNTTVTLGGALIPAGSVTVNNATWLLIVAPAHAAGTVALSVTTPGGTSTNVPGGYTYLAVPTVSGITPGAGTTAGGQAVTITGSSFATGATVTLGGSPATNITVVSATQITATTPAHAAGNVDVVVATAGGTATLVGGYTYGVPQLAVTAGNMTIEGDEGGAGGWTTTSGTTAYVISNPGSDTLNWSATLPAFVSGTPLSGSLAPGASVTVTPAANATASGYTPGIYTGTFDITSNGGAESRTITLTVRDATAPALVGMPSNITQTIVAPATTAVVTWTPPTATDNMPGATVSQIAGLPPGSAFPIGITTNTYRATDAAGNTTDGSFTVTVNQIAQGTLTLTVETGDDGAFTFTSSAPGFPLTVTTSGGAGTAGPVGIPAGTYPLSAAIPAGFGVVSATCSAGSTLSPATLTGNFTIAPATPTTCTIRTENALGETAAALGAHLETRAALILQNAPDATRRLDRLTGTGASAGGISGFGITMGAGVLPFAMNLAADEMRFSMSLLGASRVEGGRMMPSRSARRTGGVADPLGDSLFGMADDRLLGSVSPAAEEPQLGATTGSGLPADPMAHRFDIWVEGRFARFDTPGGDGHFGILHLGADYLVSRNLLVGAGVQFDWLEEDTVLGGSIDSQGFLAGPYLTARLSENLFLDLRAAWGTADADVSPFGTYVDGVESDRSLFTGALIGDFESGNLRIRPEARLTWYREETASYVDGLGVTIPGFTIESGYFEFGPELAYMIATRDGASLLPSLTLQGVWTFAQDNTASAPSNAPGLADTGLRGRVELGLAYAKPGFSIAAATYYDGVGDTDFEAWGARVRLSLGF